MYGEKKEPTNGKVTLSQSENAMQMKVEVGCQDKKARKKEKESEREEKDGGERKKGKNAREIKKE